MEFSILKRSKNAISYLDYDGASRVHPRYNQNPKIEMIHPYLYDSIMPMPVNNSNNKYLVNVGCKSLQY